MNNKTNKLILPAKIISHAEKSHSIINLDRKIFEVAVKKASREKTEPLIMINMSNITITSLNLEDYITNTLRKYNYPPNRIILEVTESSEITNFSDVNNFINNMNKIGIEFSLDDFGAGFSSFIYLKLLKISYLKIDKKIIKGLLDNKADNYILSAIALLTKKFNIKTIAEGVENEVILNAVHHYDIDFLQGFHLARPVENAFEAYPCHQQAANTGS